MRIPLSLPAYMHISGLYGCFCLPCAYADIKEEAYGADSETSWWANCLLMGLCGGCLCGAVGGLLGAEHRDKLKAYYGVSEVWAVPCVHVCMGLGCFCFPCAYANIKEEAYGADSEMSWRTACLWASVADACVGRGWAAGGGASRRAQGIPRHFRGI